MTDNNQGTNVDEELLGPVGRTTDDHAVTCLATGNADVGGTPLIAGLILSAGVADNRPAVGTRSPVVRVTVRTTHVSPQLRRVFILPGMFADLCSILCLEKSSTNTLRSSNRVHHLRSGTSRRMNNEGSNCCW